VIVTYCSDSNILYYREWDEALLEEAIKCLKEDLPLADGAPGGMINYRKTLTISFFFKFYETVKYRISKLQVSTDSSQ